LSYTGTTFMFFFFDAGLSSQRSVTVRSLRLIGCVQNIWVSQRGRQLAANSPNASVHSVSDKKAFKKQNHSRIVQIMNGGG